MADKTINFSRFQLYYETVEAGATYVAPTFDTFKYLETDFDYEKDEKTIFRAHVIKHKDHIFIEFRYGNAEPRADKVTNVVDKTERENPRKKEEAELRNQLFVYIDYEKEWLFLSNRQYKKFFEKILEEKLGLNFTIKTIISDIDEFIGKISKVGELQFTSTEDLFSHNQAQRNALADLTGTSAPTRLTLKTEYKGAQFKGVLPFLRSLNNEAKRHALKGLVIKGNNDQDVEQVYNADSLISKTAIKVVKDINGIVDPEVVLVTLKSEIEQI